MNDGTKVLPKTGGNITVLNNDIYGAPTGVTSVTTANVSLTITYNGGISGLTVNSDGILNVPASTPAGTYNNVEYRICTLTTPVVCDTATLTIVKEPEIIANDDVFSGVVSTTNITVGNVLNNPPSGSDTLNGNQATTANVAIAVVTPAVGTVVPYLTPATGNVVIPTGTPTGTYTITYRICEKDQTGTPTTNCDTATVTVNVTSPIVTPTPTVHATPDTFTYSGTATQTVGNVLTNDTVSGTTSATTSNVTISQVTTPTGAVVPRIDTTNGDVIVPNNTPAGIYTITYQICTVATPTACATTTVQVTVPAATPTPTIAPIAVDDRATTPLNTPIVVNVLANDTLNGATTPNVVANPANGTVIVNLDGSIEYRPNTGFTGTDTFVYELCNPQGNCDRATVTIEVINTIIPYNGMSVDGDGKNDYFHIGGIESYPNNVVRIYNRWGVKVFETEGYDNVTRVFRGISNGRVTVNAPEKLPQGTYYYVIEYYDHNNNKESKVGWLYIKK